MGLFGKKKEKCPACQKPFEVHDEYVNHVTNIHPPHKPCPKCQNVMEWKQLSMTLKQEWFINYICSDCGFVGESWKMWNSWDNTYLKKKY